MITLKDIPSIEVLEPLHFEKLDKLIKEKQPESVEDVKKLTEEYPDMYWGRVIPRIKECEYRIRASNFYNREPIKYYTTTYEDETLYITDAQNCANILPLYNPLIPIPPKYSKLMNETIKSIKQELQYCTPDGTNYFLSKGYNIGQETVNFLIEAIKRYENQVIINSKLTNNRKDNLLLYQHDEKYSLIEKYYKEIITYLIHNYESTIWQKLSFLQKEAWKKTIKQHRQNDIEARKRIIEYLTNYSTLDEIKELQNNDFTIVKKLTK